MSEIVYRYIDYVSHSDREEILALYQTVFHVVPDYDNVFCRLRSPLGVVAVDRNSGRIAGHFTTLRFIAQISGKCLPFRMSMGFMVSPERRGEGIALNLYRHLRQAILKNDDAAFVIGFPNDTSYKMHIQHMEYELQRDYHFITLPPKTSCGTGRYRLTDDILKGYSTKSQQMYNSLEHSAEYMLWRYGDPKYDKWLSENGRVFISTRFMDKADLLYWSEDCSEGDLLDFAAFLYKTQGVKRVATWNTSAFLDAFPAETRNYHMCINYLNASPEKRADIQKNWFFYMGDCELF